MIACAKRGGGNWPTTLHLYQGLCHNMGVTGGEGVKRRKPYIHWLFILFQGKPDIKVKITFLNGKKKVPTAIQLEGGGGGLRA